MSDPPRPRRSALRRLVRMLWVQPLWAIPFALFFGLLNDRGQGLPVYAVAFQASLVMSYAIGLALWAAGQLVVPRVQRYCPPDLTKGPEWRIAATYIAAAVVGSYIGAFILHRTLIPGILGNARSVVTSGVFTLLFSALFGGISMASVYYRQAVERARAVETMRAELAEAELRALRAQINPHFLFNTLNSIAALIRVDPAAAEATTTRLADVFRYTLRASDSGEARLGDELAFLRQYLAIERTRFGTRLVVEEDIARGLEDARIPSMLLQPLVENAVRYAISPRADGGILRLAARADGALLRLTVADDGPGLDATARASGNGFGLHSVRERLRAAGPPHALDIRTAPGAGTVIEITLPLRSAAAAPPRAARTVASMAVA